MSETFFCFRESIKQHNVSEFLSFLPVFEAINGQDAGFVILPKTPVKKLLDTPNILYTFRIAAIFEEFFREGKYFHKCFATSPAKVVNANNNITYKIDAINRYEDGASDPLVLFLRQFNNEDHVVKFAHSRYLAYLFADISVRRSKLHDTGLYKREDFSVGYTRNNKILFNKGDDPEFMCDNYKTSDEVMQICFENVKSLADHIATINSVTNDK